MYKSINGLTPLHLTDALVMACDVHDRNKVKPVCNDHLYYKIYYLWFIQ